MRSESSRSSARTGMKPLAVVPSVIAAFYNDVHFLPNVLADIPAVENGGGRIKRETPRVPQTHRVKLRAHVGGADRQAVEIRRADKRIVRWNGVIDGAARIVRVRGMWMGGQTASQFVHVDAQKAGEKILIDALAVVVLIIPAAFIADRNVKITLRTKVQIAAVVVAGLVVLVDQNEFRIGVSLGWIARRGLKTGKALVQGVRRNARGRRSRGVIDVEQPVRRITGVKREAEQTALVAGRAAHDPAGNIEEDRARGIGAVRDDRNTTALFDHKEPVGLARWRDDGDRIGERQGPDRI